MKTKICSRCGVEKSTTEFYKKATSKDGLRNPCKQCYAVQDILYHKKWHLNNKAKRIPKIQLRKREIARIVNEYKKTKKCSICPESRWYTLDFHHVKTKKYTISAMVRKGISWRNIKKEIAKCIIVCANCHRELHHKARGGV
jgi:hypothetical protein